MNNTYLNRGKLSEIEHIRSFRHPINGSPHLSTLFRVPNTGTNLPPVAITGHALLQPPRIVLKVIVGVSPVHHPSTRPFVRDNVCEDYEPNQHRNDHEHDNEVESHEEGVSVTRARETRQGNHHDAHADYDQRPLKELETIRVVCPAA